MRMRSIRSSRWSTPDYYDTLLTELTTRVAAARSTAQRMVNTQLVELYWEIGRTILQRQARDGWGTRVITRLSADLRREFPHNKGLSVTNLQYMRGFAAAWADGPAISQQPVGKLPWGHIVVLLDKLDDRAVRDLYAEAAVEFGWSRNVLTNQILNRSLERTGTAASNFATHLEPRDSELAQQIAKDPYVFDFLDLSGAVAERDLENALMDKLADTLHELSGPGSRSSAARSTSTSTATTSISICCSSTSNSSGTWSWS